MRQLDQEGKLRAAVERAIAAADWEPGDVYRAMQELRRRYEQIYDLPISPSGYLDQVERL